MKIDSKGQVTIPHRLRDHARLLPGTEVEISFVDGSIVPKKKEVMKSPRSVRRLIDRMIGKGEIKMTTDEILHLTRGRR